MYDAGSQDEAPAPGQVVEVRVQQPVPGTARQGCNIWIIKKSTAIYGNLQGTIITNFYWKEIEIYI